MTTGKTLPTALYLHLGSIDFLSPELVKLILVCRSRYDIPEKFNVIKLFRRDFRISFLSYPDFFESPHPILREAVTLDLATGARRYFNYVDAENPPILHRKEELLHEGHPRRQEFTELTAEEERQGLLNDKAHIGFLLGWQKVLREKKVEFRKGRLMSIADGREESMPLVRRHRTAISRTSLSKPVQLLLDHGMLRPGSSFFDYGCGQGDDIRLISELGIAATGWDPVFRPEEQKNKSDIVNLGFVLNVIEDPVERAQTLREAFSMAGRVLVVSVISIPHNRTPGRPHGDGFLTERGTFQKYFSQSELRQFVEDVLDTTAVAAALGVFFVFKDPAEQQEFIASRTRRTIDWSSLCKKLERPVQAIRSQLLYAENKELLESFWQCMLDLGRIPMPDEFERLAELRQRIGSGKRALGIFIARYGQEALETVRREKMNDWLVFLALVNFRKRVSISQFPKSQQADIRTFFGSLSAGMAAGQKLLFQIADAEYVAAKCDQAGVGWCDEQALYLHRDLVNSLDPLLRVYVGCAEILFGDLRQADIVKIHKRSAKVTVLKYDEFDTKVFPELETRVKINLRTQVVDVFDHRDPEMTQLLYFKERFVTQSHPSYAKWSAHSKKLRNLGINESMVGGPYKQQLEELLQSLGLTTSLSRRRQKQQRLEH